MIRTLAALAFIALLVLVVAGAAHVEVDWDALNLPSISWEH